MDNNIDNLKKLIWPAKDNRFIDRLFGWGKIREQLIDAVGRPPKIHK